MITAGATRLRPIIMTSLATIAGVLPLALGFGAGAENRGPLARCVVGGIFLSTMVTLVVVPCFYVLLEKIRIWLDFTREPRGESLSSISQSRPESRELTLSS